MDFQQKTNANREINNTAVLDYLLVALPWLKGKQRSPLFWFSTWKSSFFYQISYYLQLQSAIFTPSSFLCNVFWKATLLLCHLKSYSVPLSWVSEIFCLDSFSQQLENIVINVTCHTSLSTFLLTGSTSSIFCHI